MPDQTEAEVLSAAREWRVSGRRVAIATVVSTWGSSPRPAGSHLAVREDGFFLGSVSGGCIEGRVVEEALQVLQTGTPRIVELGVTDDEASQMGLACGGRVEVFVEALE